MADTSPQQSCSQVVMKVLNVMEVIDNICESNSEDEDNDTIYLPSTLDFLEERIRIPSTRAASVEDNEDIRLLSTMSTGENESKQSENTTHIHCSLKDAENPLTSYENSEFETRYHFTKETVQDILQMILYGLTKYTKRGQPVPPMVELLITLRFLATGAFTANFS